MIAVTAEEFQAAALAWIAALTLIITALIGAIAKLWPLVQAFKGMSDRLDDHSRRITANSQKVTDIALDINPKEKQTDTKP